MASNGQKTVTLYDVAELVGVSYQTVSRVINNQPRVSPETRQRVLQAIEALNYRPSYAAQRLAANKSKTVAIVTFGVGNYGPKEMLQNMEQYAYGLGYELLLAYVDLRDRDSIKVTIDRLLRGSVDGVVSIAPVESSYYEFFLAELAGIPVFHVDTDPARYVASVGIDQYEGSQLATQHLIDFGHEKLCEICGPLNWFAAQNRHRGFLEALARRGLKPVAVQAGDWSPASGYAAARNLLKRQGFSGIVVGNDHMALGVLSAIAESGLRVPDDISVVGFDNVSESPYYIPALTSVAQDFVELGMTAIKGILELIDNPEHAVQPVTIRPHLVIRKSAAPPRRG